MPLLLTKINNVAITPVATGATLTLVDGKTLTISNSLTFAGTDGSTLTIGSGGTLGTAAYVADNTLMHLAGTETATGAKTFSAAARFDAKLGVGAAPTYSIDIVPAFGADGLRVQRRLTGAGNGQYWGFFVDNAGATDAFIFGFTSSTFTTGGPFGWVGNSQCFFYYPNSGDFRIGTGVGSNPVITCSTSGNVAIGTATTVTKFTVAGLISALAGTSTQYAKLGGVIFDYNTDATVGGAEADVFTDTIIANTLGTNKDKIRVVYGLNFITVGTEAVQLKQYFGGTAIWDSTAVVVPTGTTSAQVVTEIIRVSASVVRYTVTLTTSSMTTGFNYCKTDELTGLTLSSTNVLKITGASSGTGSGSGDIVGRAGYAEWKSAA